MTGTDDYSPERLADRARIQDVMYRWCRAVEHCGRLGLLRTCPVVDCLAGYAIQNVRTKITVRGIGSVKKLIIGMPEQRTNCTASPIVLVFVCNIAECSVC